MKTKHIIVIAIIIIAALFLTQSKPKITNFEECIEAGNPAMESYPRQCRDPNTDKTFTEVIKEKIYCTEEQRNVDACIEIYDPVCGWDNSEIIQCLVYPCASDYSNSCKACSNPNVLYYTKEECPKSNS